MFWCFWISQRGKPLRAEHCERFNHVFFMSPNGVNSIGVKNKQKNSGKNVCFKKASRFVASVAFYLKILDLYNHFRCLKCAEYRLHLCIWVFALSSVEGLTDPALISLLISCGFVSWGEQCKREGPLYSGRDALAALELWPSGQDLAQAFCPRIPWEVARPMDTEQHCNV